MARNDGGTDPMRMERLAGAAFVFLLLLGAEIIPRMGLIDTMLFRPTTEVVGSFLRNSVGAGHYDYLPHVITTLQRFVIGFVTAVMITLPLGIVMARWSTGERLFVPLVNFLYPLPVSALIPPALGLFGFTHSMYASLVALACGIPIFMSTLDAAQQVDRTFIETSRTLGAHPRTVFWRVMFPAALPGIVTGVQVASALGVVVVIAAEMVASSEGMGWLVLHAQRHMHIADVYAGILLVAIFGFVVTSVTSSIGSLLVRWDTVATEKRW